MELTQIGRRILMQHWWLIVACVVVALSGVLLLERGQPSTYTADARLVLDTQDPTTRQEAAAIADIAKALATSPGQVSEALRKAGIDDRDPSEVARANVTVENLGSSGMLALSVRDRSPEYAAAIANALAAAVIRTRLGFTRGTSRTVLADVDRRLTGLRRRISRSDAKIAALSARGNPGATEARGRSARDAAARARQSLTAQEGVLESERVSLLTAAAEKPRPAIVSAATPPVHADPSEFAVHLVLAVLLGLLLGIGLAGLREILRPTVVGGDAVAREFDAPLLGTLPAAPDREAALTELTRVASRLSLAMRATRLPSVSLLAAGPDVDLRPLAARLDAGSPTAVARNVPVGARSTEVTSSATSGVTEIPEHGSGNLRVHALATAAAPPTNGHAIGGLVVVAPASLTMAEVTETTQLLRLSSTPVIGVIAYNRPRL